MEEGIGQVLGARAKLQRRDEFGRRVKRHPHPYVMRLVPQGRVQFIQLHMAEGQVLKEVHMYLFGVLARTREPQAQRHLRVMEEPGRIRDTQTQVDDQQGLSDLSRGSAKTIQRRASPTGKALVAGLTLEPLDAIRAALAVTDQSVEGGIGVAVIVAVWVGASITRGAEGLGSTARALAFTPGQDPRLAHVAHEGYGMRTSTHWAIIRRAWLQRTRRLAFGQQDSGTNR